MQGELFQKHIDDGWTYAQIAEKYDTSRGAVSGALQRFRHPEKVTEQNRIYQKRYREKKRKEEGRRSENGRKDYVVYNSAEVRSMFETYCRVFSPEAAYRLLSEYNVKRVGAVPLERLHDFYTEMEKKLNVSVGA